MGATQQEKCCVSVNEKTNASENGYKDVLLYNGVMNLVSFGRVSSYIERVTNYYGGYWSNSASPDPSLRTQEKTDVSFFVEEREHKKRYNISGDSDTLKRRKHDLHTRRKSYTNFSKVLSEKSICSRHGIKVEREKTSFSFLKRTSTNTRTVHVSQVPKWQAEKYISHGYRKHSNSYRTCISSLSYLHNETINILSHLAGGIICITKTVQFFLNEKSFSFADIGSSISVERIKRYEDYTVILFMSCALLCMFFSVSYHLFNCHSERHAKFWLKCDYVGILTLILATFCTSLYYGFYFQLKYLYIYVLSTLFFVLFTLSLSHFPFFSKDKYRWFRTLIFTCLCLYGIFPITHYCYLYGLGFCFEQYLMQSLIKMLLTYGLAALIYNYRLPERRWPGKFNYFMASHQIFHVLVVCAILIYFDGLVQTYEENRLFFEPNILNSFFGN